MSLQEISIVEFDQKPRPFHFYPRTSFAFRTQLSPEEMKSRILDWIGKLDCNSQEIDPISSADQNHPWQVHFVWKNSVPLIGRPKYRIPCLIRFWLKNNAGKTDIKTSCEPRPLPVLLGIVIYFLLFYLLSGSQIKMESRILSGGIGALLFWGGVWLYTFFRAYSFKTLLKKILS